MMFSRDGKHYLTLESKRAGRRIAVAVKDGETTVLADYVDPVSDISRRRFLDKLLAADSTLTDEALHEIEKKLRELGAERVDGRDTGGKASQSDLLVALAGDVELFHEPGGDEGYAMLDIDGHRETWPLHSRGFKIWLAHQFYVKQAGAPQSSAITDALNVLIGRAIHEGPKRQVAVRSAERDGKVYLDLGDEQWRAVEISAGKWAIVDRPPVVFIRKPGLLPLPMPKRGGSLDDFRALVNVTSEEDWRLLSAWMIATIRGRGPYPVLALGGEQGSAKSTLSRLLRELLDPNKASIRRPPRSEHDLIIAAKNSLLCAFDNLSHVPDWLADAFCALATGGSFATRRLYTDDDEVLFDSTRPILINGISDLATRSDLADRTIALTLGEIPDRLRMKESDLWARFREMHPFALGALLDILADVLRVLPSIELDEAPRMADFAHLGTAVERVLGWAHGAFEKAYSENRATAESAALEASAIGSCLLRFMEGRSHTTILTRALLEALDAEARDRERNHPGWPKTARGLGDQLRRLAPILRAEGLRVERVPRSNRGIRIRLSWIGSREEQRASHAHVHEPGAHCARGERQPLTRTTGNGDEHEGTAVEDPEAEALQDYREGRL